MQYWSAFQPTWYAVCSRCSARRHDSSTICDRTLASLHWLRVPERVQYKIAVLTFNVLRDSAQRYLGPLVAVAELSRRQALRSASTSRLVAPHVKLCVVDSSAFPITAAQVWNGLSESIVSSSSLQTFRGQLKTHLFCSFHT